MTTGFSRTGLLLAGLLFGTQLQAAATDDYLGGLKALEGGAFALVVGGAITRPAEITARFTGAINAAKK